MQVGSVVVKKYGTQDQNLDNIILISKRMIQYLKNLMDR